MRRPTGSVGDRENHPTDIDGNEVVGIDGEVVNVTGNVTLRRGDQFLGTDNLEYAQDSGTCRHRHRALPGFGMRIVADRLEGNQETESHRMDNVRYQLTERRGNGGAERVEMTGSQGRMMRSTYSTCPPSQRMWNCARSASTWTPTPAWAPPAAPLCTSARCRCCDVPWAAFPIDDRRRTGLLYPTSAIRDATASTTPSRSTSTSRPTTT